ncbi:MAG: XTP/dITP diphosphatase [Clostridia bacterium]|nr:XTP/dITP diphosphatase [Clostridia bacterium]
MNKTSFKKLLVATGNRGKLKEIREILSGVEVLGLFDLPFPLEIEEDGDTFYANALKKASVLAEKMSVPVLADDSGLEVDALGGEPGVYSARYSGENATDESNTQKLLCALENVPYEKRTARFVCVMCLVMPDGTVYDTRGDSEGIILTAPQGDNGFGYDPVFYNEFYKKTFAEMTLDEKNTISHRGIALEKMREILNKVL